MKIQFVGITTNCTQKNKGDGLFPTKGETCETVFYMEQRNSVFYNCEKMLLQTEYTTYDLT